MLRRWARTVEGLGFDLLLISDHVVLTPDVVEQYPPPFYEPFTTLAWLAGVTDRIGLGTTTVVLPYRHPLLVARMAANLQDLSGGRFVLGVAAGWAEQEFAALGVPFERRGALTDEYLTALRAAWADEGDYRSGQIPIWIGGNSEAAMRRAVRHDAAWHPLRRTVPALRDAAGRLAVIAAERQRPTPALVPRIALRLTDAPITDAGRLVGEGSIEQIVADLAELRRLGSATVVLDPFDGDPRETLRPEPAWQALAAVAAHWRPDPEEEHP
jgi:alkanesulfonate monooxygenase SsuD/methylene tetrahydromethanopterin reductase-like flavin-dependent oxidoreductase (luciferase family)